MSLPAALGAGLSTSDDPNPFRTLITFAHGVAETERNRSLARNGRPRSLSEASPDFTSRELELDKLRGKSMAVAHKTGYPAPDVESRVKAVRKAVVAVLKWEFPHLWDEIDQGDVPSNFLVEKLNALYSAVEDLRYVADDLDGRRASDVSHRGPAGANNHSPIYRNAEPPAEPAEPTTTSARPAPRSTDTVSVQQAIDEPQRMECSRAIGRIGATDQTRHAAVPPRSDDVEQREIDLAIPNSCDLPGVSKPQVVCVRDHHSKLCSVSTTDLDTIIEQPDELLCLMKSAYRWIAVKPGWIHGRASAESEVLEWCVQHNARVPERLAHLIRPETPMTTTTPSPNSTIIPSKAAVEKPNSQPQRRGRRPDTDPKKDRQIADAWASGSYQTYEQLANEFRMKAKEIEQALDRHRKRQPATE